MKAKTKCPKKHKSVINAPTSLPFGPPYAYPHAYISLPIIMASPTAADGIGKYIPATNKNITVLPNI